MAFVWLHRVQWVRLWSNRNSRSQCYLTKKGNSIINCCSKFDCKYCGVESGRKISIKAKVHEQDGGEVFWKQKRIGHCCPFPLRKRKKAPRISPLFWFSPLVKHAYFHCWTWSETLNVDKCVLLNDYSCTRRIRKRAKCMLLYPATRRAPTTSRVPKRVTRPWCWPAYRRLRYPSRYSRHK